MFLAQGIAMERKKLAEQWISEKRCEDGHYPIYSRGTADHSYDCRPLEGEMAIGVVMLEANWLHGQVNVVPYFIRHDFGRIYSGTGPQCLDC